ncbi:UDP-glycosyltransferase 73C6-like [Asparagus officinalis]|uniref:UDP-glycosyltransferase 73C6-like n=1 Tax=Asparagus officinalis TaxID=4686 RepID=UPI00098E263C|nr:UDP-glycosyltransferase 73C6-like [Asparagus officinalis]
MTNNSSSNDSDDQKPHFVLVPLPAPGHIIPMVDMAHLLADHGALVTLITTPVNASRLQTVIDRIAELRISIRFLSLPFPSTEVGLPEGCENLDDVPSNKLLSNFLQACALLREPLLHHFQRHEDPHPDCIVSDAGHIWTHKLARELGIPRFTFNGFGCFALVCRHIFHFDRIIENMKDDVDTFVLPGLPHRLEMTRSHSPVNFTGPGFEEFRKELMDIELAAEGVLVNSFDNLEDPYVQCLQKARGTKVWTVGPMSLYNKNVSDMVFRGNKGSTDENRCLSWLDSMKPHSVIYVSFGSLARTSPSQLIEIGLGLEASNCPFIWVIKAGSKSSEIEEWLSQGFEERTSMRALIIRGWAPQLMILSHPAIGGFMTHCGWNSTLESACAGVPMITWPHFAEQFLNEKLIVEILRIGITIGVKAPVKWGTEQDEDLVGRDHVKETVSRLMVEGEERRIMREMVKELGKKAKKSMEEGGSSYGNMDLLVQQIRSKMMMKKEQ